jgi:hypothetical protein
MCLVWLVRYVGRPNGIKRTLMKKHTGKLRINSLRLATFRELKNRFSYNFTVRSLHKA